MQDERLQCEQHQRTEIQQVLGDTTRLDVGEVGECLDIGRIGQPQRSDDHERAEHQVIARPPVG